MRSRRLILACAATRATRARGAALTGSCAWRGRRGIGGVGVRWTLGGAADGAQREPGAQEVPRADHRDGDVRQRVIHDGPGEREIAAHAVEAEAELAEQLEHAE